MIESYQPDSSGSADGHRATDRASPSGRIEYQIIPTCWYRISSPIRSGAPRSACPTRTSIPCGCLCPRIPREGHQAHGTQQSGESLAHRGAIPEDPTPDVINLPFDDATEKPRKLRRISLVRRCLSRISAPVRGRVGVIPLDRPRRGHSSFGFSACHSTTAAVGVTAVPLR